MRLRVLQAKDDDNEWYDDAYAYEDSSGQVIFRCNLTWENLGPKFNRKLQETGTSLAEIETVIEPGEALRWLPVEEIEADQAEAYLQELNQRCAIPDSRAVSQLLANLLTGEKASIKS